MWFINSAQSLALTLLVPAHQAQTGSIAFYGQTLIDAGRDTANSGVNSAHLDGSRDESRTSRRLAGHTR